MYPKKPTKQEKQQQWQRKRQQPKQGQQQQSYQQRQWYTANVLSAESTDECLRTKSKDN